MLETGRPERSQGLVSDEEAVRMMMETQEGAGGEGWGEMPWEGGASEIDAEGLIRRTTDGGFWSALLLQEWGGADLRSWQ